MIESFRDVDTKLLWDTGKLGVSFGLTAQFWLNLQNDYDLRLATSDALAKIKPFQAA